MTYLACKTIIESGRYVKEDMMQKLDIFLLGNRITAEEYDALKNMLG